jgi:DNA mismatch repair protein MSH6
VHHVTGYAIAHAVLHHLVEKTKCRLMFATHYHMLTDTFAANPDVALHNMSYLANEGSREITFLYKLLRGVCPKSFGLNCASKAGVPEEVIVHAEQKSKEFEANSTTSATSAGMAAVTRICSFKELNQLLCRGGGGDGSSSGPTDHDLAKLKALVESLSKVVG